MKMSTRLGKGKAAASLVALLMGLAVGDPGWAYAQQVAASQRPGNSSAVSQESSESSSQFGQTDDASLADDEIAEVPEAPTPQNAPSNSSTADQNRPPENKNDQPEQERRPLGTAVAPEAKPTGVAGSRPAGAVIAPAKQRRVHAILISIGLLAGAGVAIGTVAALSNGSPARP